MINCGCKVFTSRETWTAKFEYCPMHKAAPELLEALKGLQHADGCYCEAAFAPPGTIVAHTDECLAALDAISKAEGK